MIGMNIRRHTFFPYLLVVLGFLFLFTVDSMASVSYRNLIPEPVRVIEKEGAPFVFDGQTKVICSDNRPEWKYMVDSLMPYLSAMVGRRISVGKTKKLVEKNIISFIYEPQIRKEGFRLKITEEKLDIEASDGAGAFYAVQLLRELSLSRMDKQAGGSKETNGKKRTLCFPPVELEDYPSMAYRGAMLDVSRHFFSVGQVKRYIDLLAFHRLNHFHWHLTDDQGWRIEIKKYPELTKTGAWRGVENYGGYYTQEEIKEIVAYAARRYITIIPEIDMPGHTQAALAAYPELGCTKSSYKVATEAGGVHKDVMCIGSDFTFSFVKDVLKEVAELFPAPYVHIGGDEVPKDRWKQCVACQNTIMEHGLEDTSQHTAEELLQRAFNEETALYLCRLGKRMIGWDEVLADGLNRDVIVMSWRGLGCATTAIHKGHNVIVSADSHLYLNHYQTIDSEQEPRATGGLVEMKKVFETPFYSQQLSEVGRTQVLGAEACLWTSFIDSDQLLDYMLLPRLAAFAEAVWCEGRRSTYNHFLQRLPSLLRCYGQLGYGYANHFFTISAAYKSIPSDNSLMVSLESLPDTEIYYTLDGTEPTKAGFLYKNPIRIDRSCTLKAVSYSSNGLSSDKLTKEVVVNKATFKPVHLQNAPSKRYWGENGKVLVDGVRSINFHNTGLWVGCISSDMIAIIDLEYSQKVNTVEVSALTDLSAWIMGPKSISVYVSSDGKDYKLMAHENYQAPTDAMEKKHSDLHRLSFEKHVSARYVKVVVMPFKGLPAGHSGEGKTPFLFVDEIRVN